MRYLRNYRFILAVLAVCLVVCFLLTLPAEASGSEGSYIAPNGQTYLYCYEFTTTEKATSMQDWTWKTWSDYPLVIVHDTGNPTSLHQLHYLDPETGEVKRTSGNSFYCARYKPDGTLFDQDDGSWGPYHYNSYPAYDNEGRIFCTNPYPEFDTMAEAKAYLEKLSNPEPEGVYDDSLENPHIILVGNDTDGGSKFAISNGAEDLFIEIKGRWWSVDDIELYKENAMWKYRYSSRLHSNLSDWIAVSEGVGSTLSYSFSDIGQSAFEQFLLEYPVDERSYTGGTNALGNFFSGYNDALETMKKLHLSNMCTSYVGPEIYCRFYYDAENGSRHFSKWTHFYSNLARPTGSSGSIIDDRDNLYTTNQSSVGLTDDDVERLEQSGNSLGDSDLTPSYDVPVATGVEAYTQNFVATISSMVSSLGQVPALLSAIVSWLPSFVPTIIGVGLSSIILLRFIGR